MATAGSSPSAAAIEEARELQEQEISLLECVYDAEDLKVVRSGGDDDKGRIQRIEYVLMRTAPTAVIFAPQERKQGALPSEKSVPAESIVWSDGAKGSEGGSNSGGSSSVPIGYICQKPMLVTLSLTIPLLYPTHEPLRHWLVQSNRLTREEQQDIASALRDLVADLTGINMTANAAADSGASNTTSASSSSSPPQAYDGSPMIQIVIETAREHLEASRKEEAEDMLQRAKAKVERRSGRGGGGGGGEDDGGSDGDDDFDAEAQLLLYQHRALDTSTLGRRCIYYHHILSGYKRCVIMSMARRLDLRGFCKIGYPGILIVEGSEEACEIYVQILQRLRWKLMVVRGEERIEASSAALSSHQSSSKNSSSRQNNINTASSPGYASMRAVIGPNLRSLFGGTLLTPPINGSDAPQSSSSSASTSKGGGKGSRAANTQKKSKDNDGGGGGDGYDSDGNPINNSQQQVNAVAMQRAEDHLASRPILETSSAEEIASWCAMCGLSVLFRTVMKIYG